MFFYDAFLPQIFSSVDGKFFFEPLPFLAVNKCFSQQVSGKWVSFHKDWSLAMIKLDSSNQSALKVKCDDLLENYELNENCNETKLKCN